MDVRYKGSTTIELALLIPVILLVFISIINSVFYFQDKNVLYSTMYEVEAIARQEYRTIDGINEEELKLFLLEKLDKRLILFSNVVIELVVDDKQIYLEVKMEKNKLSICMTRTVEITYPERTLRYLQVLGLES